MLIVEIRGFGKRLRLTMQGTFSIPTSPMGQTGSPIRILQALGFRVSENNCSFNVADSS